MMSRLLPVAVVLGAAVLVRAQDDFRITWHAQDDATCGAGAAGGSIQTVVVGPQNLCHRVPNSATAGYRVTCNAAGAGGGVFSVCTDPQCSSCDVNTPFEENQCLPNPPEFGSASVNIQCQAPLPPPPAAPAAGEAILTWYESATCVGAPRTVVLPKQDLCQTVPQSPDAGYKVTCNADGSGSFQVCQNRECSSCNVNTQFGRGQCLPNPIEFGSASVSIQCPVTESGPGALPGGGVSSPESILVNRPDDVRITWFQEPVCGLSPGSSFTGVVVPRDFCHVIPNAPTMGALQGYKVTCNENNQGGVFSVCSDATCATCSVATPFEEEQCIPNPAETGSRSVQLQCSNPLIPPTTPPAGRALITWFELEKCDPTHRSLVDVTQGLCQRVPDSATAGYRVTCSADGSGLYEVCEDRDCNSCNIKVPFGNDQCLPNPPLYGSASVSIRCPTTGPITTLPGTATGSGGATPSRGTTPGGSTGGGVGASGATETLLGAAAALLGAAAVARGVEL